MRFIVRLWPSSIFLWVAHVVSSGSNQRPLPMDWNMPSLLHSSDRSIPGGSPFELCDVSRSTDAYNISSIQFWPQPLYTDDMFEVHVYGNYLKDIATNATIQMQIDCGNRCEEWNINGTAKARYGWHYCAMHNDTEQLNKRKGCPPVRGYALTNMIGWIVPLFFHAPGWYNFTFDAKTENGERIYCVTAQVCLRWENEEKNKGYHYPAAACAWGS